MFDKEIPQHFNTRCAEKSYYFKDTDSKEQWLKNIKNPEIYQKFIKNNWQNEDAIIYQYNSHGFRDKEFDSQISYAALGCSFTEGIGLSENQIWCKMLEKKLGYKVWNLGVGGSSLDTVFRLLYYYIDKLNLKGIFVLEPAQERMEMFDNGVPISYMASNITNPAQHWFYKYWCLDEKNFYYKQLKNNLAIKMLSSEYKIDLFSTNYRTLMIPNPEHIARDLLHAGIDSHEYLTEYFIQKVNGKN